MIEKDNCCKRQRLESHAPPHAVSERYSAAREAGAQKLPL